MKKQNKIYAEVLEPSAMEQFENAMAQPFSVKGALMADAHTGYSMPIGGVVATKDAIVPAWVGYDIGCGMCAVQLSVNKDGFDFQEIYDQIYRQIPVGFHHHSTKKTVPDLPHTDVVARGLKKGEYQIGTLGGGNHFIEIGEGKSGSLWIVIHSGSRNLGHFVASYYMKLAYIESIDTTEIGQVFDDKKNSTIFKEKNPVAYAKAREEYIQKEVEKSHAKSNFEGHFHFDVNNENGKNYILDMQYCLEYALQNRKAMIDKVKQIMGVDKELTFINRNHNHAEFDGKFWIHRKGATHAEKEMLGVIPGNMRDGSFIVKGKGSDDSLCSSSHGAGRVLGRKQAKRTLSMDDFKEQMQGKYAKVVDDTLDEAPNAYKNIYEVMELQKELVEIIDHVKPIVNIKG
ncbi:MAG: RtcB family protein [Leptospirales bacterium]